MSRAQTPLFQTSYLPQVNSLVPYFLRVSGIARRVTIGNSCTQVVMTLAGLVFGNLETWWLESGINWGTFKFYTSRIGVEISSFGFCIH